jgi:toxin ParE1/3/4
VSAGERHWTVRVTAAAEGDFQEIVRWTLAYFGEDQARVYGETLSDALQALTSGPSVAGARQRDDIAKGLLTLHVRRQGRKGRHIILFRVGPDQDHEAIEVLRILHDAMDLQRHIPT